MANIPDITVDNTVELEKSLAPKKVLIINRIDISIIKKHMITNLFGWVSNPTKVLINLDAAYALVEF